MNNSSEILKLRSTFLKSGKNGDELRMLQSIAKSEGGVDMDPVLLMVKIEEYDDSIITQMMTSEIYTYEFRSLFDLSQDDESGVTLRPTNDPEYNISADEHLKVVLEGNLKSNPKSELFSTNDEVTNTKCDVVSNSSDLSLVVNSINTFQVDDISSIKKLYEGNDILWAKLIESFSQFNMNLTLDQKILISDQTYEAGKKLRMSSQYLSEKTNYNSTGCILKPLDESDADEIKLILQDSIRRVKIKIMDESFSGSRLLSDFKEDIIMYEQTNMFEPSWFDDNRLSRVKEYCHLTNQIFPRPSSGENVANLIERIDNTVKKIYDPPLNVIKDFFYDKAIMFLMMFKMFKLPFDFIMKVSNSLSSLSASRRFNSELIRQYLRSNRDLVKDTSEKAFFQFLLDNLFINKFINSGILCASDFMRVSSALNESKSQFKLNNVNGNPSILRFIIKEIRAISDNNTFNEFDELLMHLINYSKVESVVFDVKASINYFECAIKD